MAGNKGFADLVVGGGAGEGPRSPPRAGILSGRSNSLSRLASGGLVTRQHELVDPARCRIWEGHNRDYGSLDETSCADLLESLRAQGRQEVPAIVRRVTGTPGIDYEVICGARRHWSITWLCAHNYPEFRFLVEPRELTDEEAFRLADLENRHRKDLSDFERARDYARAIERYYGGSQQRMVERLEFSKSWLSRFLELARLPEDVIAAFGSPHVIAIKHAAALAPLLRVPVSKARIVQAAQALAEDQATALRTGLPPVSPLVVVRRLVAVAADRVEPARFGPMISVRGPDGIVLAQGRRGRRGGVDLFVPPQPKLDRQAVLAALDELLNQLTMVPSRRTGSSRAKSTV